MKRKTDNFNKFYNKKNNAAIKEAFRQEKKAAKKERKEAIERHFEEKRQAREAQFAAGKEKASIASHKGGSSAKPAAPTPKGAAPHDPNLIPLNKYIAHGGICSRRDAAELIRQGKVEVNDQLVTEPGTKVSPTDFVKVNGKKITISRNFIYILLNKPKDYITTTDDPQGRKTVLDLIRQATTERVYPVGRLDRNTSGVLLLTNDGDLSQKLAHPRHEIKKIYHVTLDKPLTKADFDKIAAGVQLEDGLAHVDVLAYADIKDKAQIGLEIHSGRNRIVRRIFEHLGYDVRGLDRVMYAGLTKKNVQRGHWRLLTEKEIRILKYLNASFRGSLSGPKSSAAAGVVQDEEMEESAPKTAETKKSKVPFDRKFDAPVPKEAGTKKSYGAAASGYKGADAKRSDADDERSKAPFDKPKYSGGRKSGGPSRPGGRKPFSGKTGGPSKPGARKSFSDKGEGAKKPGYRKPFAEKADGPKKPGYRKSFSDKSEGPSKPGQRKSFAEKADGPKKSGYRKSFSDRSEGPSKPGQRKSFAEKADGPKKSGYRKSFSDRSEGPSKPGQRKPFAERSEGPRKPGYRKPFTDKAEGPSKPGQRKSFAEKADGPSKPGYRKSFSDKSEGPSKPGQRKSFTEKADGPKKPGYRKPFSDRSEGPSKPGQRKPFAERSEGPRKPGYRKPFTDKAEGPSKPGQRKSFSDKAAGPARPKSAGRKSSGPKKPYRPR